MSGPFYLREDLVQSQIKTQQLRIKQLQSTSLLLL
jgi:hypothetical protein